MWRWFLILAVALIGLQAQPVSAEENMEMQVNTPLGGIMKYGEWTRIEVALTNGGDPFDGYVQLSRGDNNPNPNDKSNKFRQEIHMAAGESKNISFALPTEFLLNGNLKVQLIKGDAVIDSQVLYQNNQNSNQWGAIVDSNPNAFYFLTMNNENNLQAPGLSMDWKPLSPKAIPEESWLLHNFQAVALGNVSTLSDKQIQALKDWVREGGQLLISAGPDQDGVISRFQDILPIGSGHGGTTTKLDLLKELSGQNQLPVTSLPVYHTEQPLFVMKSVGNGRILFINYDVSAEPLASWQFNRQMWKRAMAKYHLNPENQSLGISDPMDYSLMIFSRVIPGVSLPSTEWLAVIWGIYILLVAPLLYFWLKKRDRREWAWGFIPLIAILLSIGVYTIGRMQISKQDASFSVSAVTIIDDQLAKVTTSTSFLAVSGGTYQVQSAKDFLTMPVTYSRGIENSSISQEGDQGNRLTFEQVPYLSEKLAVASGIKRDLGSFQHELRVDQNKLVGSITNHTSYDMESVSIDLGMQRVSLGAMKKGETKQVNQPLEELYLPKPSEDVNPLTGPSVEQVRKNMETAVSVAQPNALRILGRSTQPMPIMSMVSNDKRESYYTVFTQAFRLSPGTDGLVHYPSGTLEASAIQMDGVVNNTGTNAWELGKGTITFHLQLGSADLQVKRVVIPLDQSPYRPFDKEIHNMKTKQWEKLGREQRVTLDQTLGDYLNSDGNIELRFKNPTNQRLSLPAPYFTVEGEEKQ